VAFAVAFYALSKKIGRTRTCTVAAQESTTATWSTPASASFATTFWYQSTRFAAKC